MTNRFSAILFALCAAAMLTGPAHAQNRSASATPPANSGPPNALQGFSKNKDEPVQIEAATLDVRDKDKVATFSGNVHVIQGDTDLRTRKLVVYYEEDDSNKDDGKKGDGKKGDGKKSAPKTAQPGPGGSSQIKKLEAIGDVFVTQKDQTAQGDKGVFDMKTNKITLTGNVVVSQGQNVLQGEKLVVDRNTGFSTMEGGRVRGIFQRGKEEGSAGNKLPGTN
jgi:lipopolysaccharide export system protein LptA